MNKKKESKVVPNVRFKGFTDDWKQRKLGEIITEYKKTVDSDCTLPILTSSKTEGVILQEEHFGRKQQHDITGYNILPRNYCTYRNRSDGVDFTFNINKCCDKGIISKFYPVFSGKNSDVFFLSLVLNNSDEVVREIAYTCTGTGQKVLSFLDLQKMKVRVPSFDEQKEIATYFDSLDHLITLHQQKLILLTKLKKAMLEKMFPKKGSVIPEFRFNGFANAWEQQKLGNVAKFSKGSGYSKGDLIESGTPIILYGRLYTKYETSISEVDTYVEAKDGSVYSKGGEVIVPASGETAEDIARAATVDKSGVILGGDLNVVSPNEDINSAFLAISISHGNSQRELAKKAQGKSVVHIHNEEIKNLVVPFPAKAEQNKIVKYFSNLDNLIILHQHKIDKIKAMKKAMLDQIFI